MPPPGPPVTSGLSMLARQRVVPMQAAHAAIDGAARADASRAMANQARNDARAVNSMVGAIQAQRRAGQKVLPRREFPPPPDDNNSLFGDWHPSDAPSFNEIVHALQAKVEKKELAQQTYAQVDKVIKNALGGDAKSMAALAKGFQAGTAGFPVSLPWYYICLTEACRLHGLKQVEQESELPDFIRSVANLPWPPEAIQSFTATGLSEIQERWQDRSLIKSGCWILEMRNQGLATIIYKTVLFADKWALGTTTLGNGPAIAILNRQLGQLQGSLNLGNMAFAQQLKQFMQFSFEGQWDYLPGQQRRFYLSLRLTNAGEGQLESQSDFNFSILGWKQDPKGGGYTLHAQEQSTGEWFLKYLPRHDADPAKFLKQSAAKRSNRGIWIVLIIGLVLFGAFWVFALGMVMTALEILRTAFGS